jgi:hypothetical protein
MDVRHVPCGADCWGHLTAVIDCHDREVTGYEFAFRGRAKEAERAVEEASPSILPFHAFSDSHLLTVPAEKLNPTVVMI